MRTFPAPDGTAVPATVLRHVDTPLDGTAPCLMYAYGAYEAVYPDQEWDPAIPSLLDRGVVYVHAHVRGGGEGGRRWWLDGRLEHKQNTFDDHIAVADGLAGAGLVDGTRIATRGLSAGGLLQGAVFSQRPERWRAVVAEVPFVDVRHHDVRRDHPADHQRVGRVGRPAPAGGLRVDAGLLAVRQPAAGGRPPRPAGHRRGARPAGDGLGAGEVGRARCARPTRSGRRAACSASRPAPAPTSARPAASPTSPTRPRSTPGSSTARGGDPRRWLRSRR